MHFRAEVEGSQPVVVRLSGELDLATAPVLDECLAAVDGEGDVDVDCSQLDFIDAAGLTVLVRADRRLEAEGRKLVLVQPHQMFLRILEITGLDDKLEVRSDEALSA